MQQQKFTVQLSIYAVCFVNLLYLLPSVAVGGMTQAFQGYSESLVLLPLTLPNLTGIAGVLAVPLLRKKLGQKRVVLLALAALLASGLACLLVYTSLPALVVASGVQGAAYGMISASFPLLVSGFFAEPQRSRVMGIASGSLQLGRMAATLLAGLLAQAGWQHIYWCFLLALAPLVLCARCLPAALPAPSQGAGRPPRDWLDRPATAALALAAFCFANLYFLNSTHSSLYIEGYGLGTAAFTGALTAAASVVSCLCSACYGPLSQKLGRMVLPLVFLLMGAGYLAGAVWVSRAGAALEMLGAALAMSLFSPWLMLSFNRCGGGQGAATATAAVLAVQNVGYFASPYITGAVSSLLPGAGPQSVFLAAGVLGLAGGAALAAGAFLRGRAGAR